MRNYCLIIAGLFLMFGMPWMAGLFLVTAGLSDIK